MISGGEASQMDNEREAASRSQVTHNLSKFPKIALLVEVHKALSMMAGHGAGCTVSRGCLGRLLFAIACGCRWASDAPVSDIVIARCRLQP